MTELYEDLTQVKIADQDADGGYEHHCANEIAELNVQIVEDRGSTRLITVVIMQSHHCNAIVANGADVDGDDNPVDNEKTLFKNVDVWVLVLVKFVDVARPQSGRVNGIDLGDRNQDDAESSRVETVVEVVQRLPLIQNTAQERRQ